MSFLNDVQTQTRERISLSPGSYGSSKQTGLKILAYVEKASKLDKSGAMRHSFLVAATRPSREATEAAKAAEVSKNGHAEAVPFLEPDYDGTAFLSMTLHEMWLNVEATAIAFTEASRNKEGVIQADHVTKAIQGGETTQENIDRAIAYFRQVATEKCLDPKVNTPVDKLDEAVETQYKKELKQISMKVGQFLDLQKWHGVTDVTLAFDPVKLVNTEFSGKVEQREFNGKIGSEVTSIYSKKR